MALNPKPCTLDTVDQGERSVQWPKALSVLSIIASELLRPTAIASDCLGFRALGARLRS